MITISKYISPVTLSGDTTLTTANISTTNLNGTTDIVPVNDEEQYLF